VKDDVHRYRDRKTDRLRVLFCFGVTQTFFDSEPEATIPLVVQALQDAFGSLQDSYSLRVLGTFDDDELMVGASSAWPWTAYILADAPDLDAVRRVTNILRETRVGDHRLWRYIRVEARIGRPLFFGND
jgi:hypothetical protein